MHRSLAKSARKGQQRQQEREEAVEEDGEYRGGEGQHWQQMQLAKWPPFDELQNERRQQQEQQLAPSVCQSW